MNWYRGIQGKVRKQEPLRHHTTFKIGGPARFFIEPRDHHELSIVLELLKEQGLPALIIGSGSNILAADKPLQKAVIRLSAPAFKKIVCDGHNLSSGAGVFLAQLVSYTQRHGLSGCEFLAGIPGTVGGAVLMNAGVCATGAGGKRRLRNIADLVENVTVMDYNGTQKVVRKPDIRFGYRTSGLAKYIVVSARLKVKKGRKEQIAKKIRGYLSGKAVSQDLSAPSAGCVFKNPSGKAAGKLIDECGLKGMHINDAYISRSHANFIVNYGCAKAKDVLQLMNLIKKKVKAKYNITLEPEIKIWK